MKKNLIIVIVLICQAFVLNAQTSYTFQNDSVILDCTTGGVLYNPGGSGVDYSNSQNFLFTVCPNSSINESVSFDFNAANFGSGDYVCVYDGPTVTSPLLVCYNNVNPFSLDSMVRASSSNTTGCLTFQFYSDAALTGNFEIELNCIYPCQELHPEISVSSHPIVDTVYMDVCHGDTLSLTANGLFLENDLNYHQSNSNVSYYWVVGGLRDTAITFEQVLPEAGFYSVELTMEDSIGCKTINELDLAVRYIPLAEFAPVYDSIMCQGTTYDVFDQVAGSVVGGSIIFGDTIRTTNFFSVTSTAQYIPDDADNISGNGITTPATYPINVTGFIPGSVITAGSQLFEICLDIEHSFVGDLDIVLVAPNGSMVNLIDMNPPGTPGFDFGTPVLGVNPLAPGVPETYCWSPTATNAPLGPASTFIGMAPPDVYQAQGNWDNFIGSPVNGIWTIQVFDDYGGDDGNIFGASFEFDPIFIPDADSFFVSYDVVGFWDANPNIVSPLNQNNIQYTANNAGADVLYYNATNNFGCVDRDTLNLWVDSFSVTATPSDTAACAGVPVPLSATVVGPPGTYSYSWSPSTDISPVNSANPTVTLSTGGIQYTVAATSPLGCTFYDTVNVNSAASFEFAAYGDTVICAGDTTQLFATGGALTYAWSPNDGFISDTTVANPFVYPGSTTTYTVKADSTGCSQYENITIAVSNIGATIIPTTAASCGIANGGLIIIGTGGLGAYTYTLDGGTPQTNVSFTGLYGGDHIVEITDTTHCVYTDTAVVAGGGAPIIIDSVFLQNPSCGVQGIIEVFLTDTNLSVTYTNDSTMISQDSALFVGLSGGTYTISISDGVCPTVDTTISLSLSNAAVLSLDSFSNISCYNAMDGEIHLSATGGLMPYSFSIDSISFVNTGSFTNLDTGTYNIIVLDSNGCVDNSTITITQPDSLIVSNIMVDSAQCFGLNGNISFDGIGGTGTYTYSVDGVPTFGAMNSFSLPAGNYSLQVQDANNCLSEIILDTVFQPVLLSLVTDSVINANCNTNDGGIYISHTGGTAPYTYSWSDGTSVVGNTEDLNLVSSGIYTLTITDANGCSVQVIEQVFDNAPVILSLVSNDDVSCFGASDATVVLEANSGTMPYTFDIDANPGISDSTFNNVSGGLHTFTVTDANGCSNSIQITIYEPTALNLLNSSSNLTCNGVMDGEINLTAFGGTGSYLYALNTSVVPQPIGLFQNLSAATYTAYVADVNGCSDTITGIVISEPDTLIISNVVAQDVSCFGAADGSLTITATGGTLPYEYSVNGDVQTSNVYNNLSGGNYTINVTDTNNCPIAIALDTIIEPTQIVLIIDSTKNVDCFGGNDGHIEFSATGGSSPYEFSIDNGANYLSSSVFTNLVAGNYSLIIKDDNDCTSAVQNITISEPAQMSYNSSSTDVSCFGLSDGSINITTINGGTAPYTISINNAPAIPYVAGMTFNNLTGGMTYNIEIFDSSSCSYDQDITINQPTELELIENSSVDVSCFGLSDGSVDLSVTGGLANYTFILDGVSVTNNGLSATVYSNLSNGIYPTYLFDSNGCSDTLLVEIGSPDQLFIDSIALLRPMSCFGSNDASLIVYPSGGYIADPIFGDYTYLWSPDGSTDHKLGGLAAGVHSVVVTDDNGCTATASYTVDGVDPIIATITPDSSFISMGDTVNLDLVVQNAVGPLTYSWSPTTGLSCTDCSNPSVIAFNDVQYSVIVTDTNGCSNYNFTETFVLVDNSLFFFIPNSFTPNNDGLNDIFEVYGQDVKSVDMKVFNRWGEKIFEGTNQFEGWDGKYQGKDQNNGIYSYVINVKFLNDAEVVKTGSVTLIK